MSPIRVGLIGLAANDESKMGPGVWGVQAHLRSFITPKYEIVALCNSSVESATKAKELHKLPDTVRTYGNPEDLASDPDVDLVVVSVGVAKHFYLAKPALLKGKDVFVEWPLGASVQEAREMTELAKTNGIRTIVGLQFRAEPLLAKVRELLKDGAVGTVTSSAVWGSSSSAADKGWFHNAAYYLDMKSGGTELHIYFGHFLDGFTSVVGDFETVQATLQSQRSTVPLVNLETGEVVDPAHPKTTPDHILVQGILKSGAVASIAFRRTTNSVDDLGLRWRITGTEGEIEIAFPGAGAHVQPGNPAATIVLRTADNKEPQNISYEREEHAYIKEVPFPGDNTARLYESFAEKDGSYADFDAALKHHELLDRIIRSAEYDSTLAGSDGIRFNKLAE